MAEKKSITVDRLCQLLDYDPATGEFRWRYRQLEEFATQRAGTTWNTRFAGKIAGAAHDGYRVISINYRRYRAHRLAWMYVTSGWPVAEIDHIDCNPGNNRFNNLREATHAENIHNSRKRSNNTSGVKGVYWDKCNRKWCVQIRNRGTQKHIGLFDTIESAALAYAESAAKLHREFARIE